MSLKGLGEEGRDAGGSGCQGGGHSAHRDSERVGSAHNDQLRAGVESIPAEPQDHHAQHKERGVVASKVVGLHMQHQMFKQNPCDNVGVPQHMPAAVKGTLTSMPPA